MCNTTCKPGEAFRACDGFSLRDDACGNSKSQGPGHGAEKEDQGEEEVARDNGNERGAGGGLPAFAGEGGDDSPTTRLISGPFVGVLMSPVGIGIIAILLIVVIRLLLACRAWRSRGGKEESGGAPNDENSASASDVNNYNTSSRTRKIKSVRKGQRAQGKATSRGEKTKRASLPPVTLDVTSSPLVVAGGKHDKLRRRRTSSSQSQDNQHKQHQRIFKKSFAGGDVEMMPVRHANTKAGRPISGLPPLSGRRKH